MVLEAACQPCVSAFITLTYRPADLPKDGSVSPVHLKAFWRALRYQIGPFRYYGVGEYGELSGRPHYHCLVFGKMPSQEELGSSWRYGGVHVGSCSMLSAAYVAGYVTKKMMGKDDPRLKGRHPEFCRMSLKPGIGALGLAGIIKWLYSSDGAAYLGRNHDVPKSIRFEGAIYPLGRYLVQYLRNEFGLPAQDVGRSLRGEALRLENCLPDVAAKRELRREGYYQRAHFYRSMRLSKEKI